MDNYGNEVPAGCRSWYDGCNHCRVDSGWLSCTEMWCVTVGEAYCQDEPVTLLPVGEVRCGPGRPCPLTADGWEQTCCSWDNAAGAHSDLIERKDWRPEGVADATWHALKAKREGDITSADELRGYTEILLEALEGVVAAEAAKERPS